MFPVDTFGRVGCSLSGGAALSVFECGVVDVLARAGVNFKRWGGTSGGAIGASAYAHGLGSAVYNLWRSFARHGYAESLAAIFKPAVSKLGMFTLDKVEDELRRVLVGTPAAPCEVVCVNVNSGEIEYHFNCEPDFPAFVIGSASIPIALVPRRDCIDGGVRENFPIMRLLSADDVDTVIAVSCYRVTDDACFKHPKPRNVLEIGWNSLTALRMEVLRKDLWYAQRQGKRFYLIEPEAPLGDFMDFRAGTMAKRFEHGRAVAEKFLAGFRGAL